MALLKVFSSPMNHAESHCLFFAGDILLAGIGEHGGGHRRAMLAGAGGEQQPEEGGGGERGTEAPRARVPHEPQAA